MKRTCPWIVRIGKHELWNQSGEKEEEEEEEGGGEGRARGKESHDERWERRGER